MSNNSITRILDIKLSKDIIHVYKFVNTDGMFLASVAIGVMPLVLTVMKSQWP